MKDTECIELLEKYSKIILNIGNYKINNIFNIISSLTRISQYSHVKILNLKVKYEEYNNKISQIEEILDNNSYKISVNNKKLSIQKKNLILFPIILIIKYWELNSFENKKYLNLAFNIPTNNNNIIVIFYKNDLYFEDLKTLNESKINAFIDRASYEDTTICNICNDEKLHLLCCSQCVNNFCYKCVLSFENKRCPYCNVAIIYKNKYD